MRAVDLFIGALNRVTEVIFSNEIAIVGIVIVVLLLDALPEYLFNRKKGS